MILTFHALENARAEDAFPAPLFARGTLFLTTARDAPFAGSPPRLFDRELSWRDLRRALRTGGIAP